jgi:hypothetical protein
MLNIGDFVRHITTGEIGQVFGYGHQIVNGVYLTTITVRVASKSAINSVNFVEDVLSDWVLAELQEIPQFANQTQISPTVSQPTNSLELKDTVGSLSGTLDPIPSEIFALDPLQQT